MSGSALGAKIKQEIVSACGAPQKPEELDAFCNALGAAIVDYIKDSAKVAAGIQVSSSTFKTVEEGTIS